MSEDRKPGVSRRGFLELGGVAGVAASGGGFFLAGRAGPDLTQETAPTPTVAAQAAQIPEAQLEPSSESPEPQTRDQSQPTANETDASVPAVPAPVEEARVEKRSRTRRPRTSSMARAKRTKVSEMGDLRRENPYQ